MSEFIAADRLGLVPDCRREMPEEEPEVSEPADMLAQYEQRKAAVYGGS